MMGQYTDLLKKGGKKEEQLAFDYLVTNLLKDNNKGDSKQVGMGGIDTEKMFGGTFIPSVFYIFAYNGENKANVSGNSFYDRVPLILCTSSDAKKVSGINFNYVPNNVRAAFLDILTGSYKDFYKEGSGGVINEKFGSKLIDAKNLSTMLSLMKSLVGVDLNKCIRTYDRSKIMNARVVEKDMYMYIPFLSFRDAVRGANLAKVQAGLITDK